MKRVRTAIAGCGKVGHIHAAALATLPEAELVAVCDNDGARAAAFGTRYGARPFEDVADMVKAASVEAVIVCTPHPLHAAPSVAAMEAGANVLVEKPLAASLPDCDRMIEAAARCNVKLGVVSQRRFFEPVARMKAAIAAGRIGVPVLGSVVMLSWRDEAYYRSDPWRGKWATEGGGVLINQSPHHLDLLQWMMGPVEEITQPSVRGGGRHGPGDDPVPLRRARIDHGQPLPEAGHLHEDPCARRQRRVGGDADRRRRDLHRGNVAGARTSGE
jgi:predicted dehydrogenase